MTNVVGVDDLTAGLKSGTARSAHKNVSSGKSLTANASDLPLSGTTARNFTLGAVSYTCNLGSITKANLAVSGITANNTSYAGMTAASLAGSASVAAFGSVVVSVTGSSSFADRNAGTGKAVTASGVTLSDDNGGANYIVTYLDHTTSTITKASLAITGVTASNTACDGTTAATLNDIAVSVAPIGADAVSVLAGSGAGTFADRNPGIGMTVGTTGSSFSGADAGNCHANQPTGFTANITPAALVVRTADASKVCEAGLGATGSAIAATGTTLYNNDSLSDGTCGDTDKNVGAVNKTVRSTGVTTNDGNGGTIYTASHVDNTTRTIIRANLEATGVTATNSGYDADTTATLDGTAMALGSDQVTVGGTASGTFVDEAVTVIGYTLSGADANMAVRVGSECLWR